MNIELRQALEAAGIPCASDPDLWKKIVMTHIVGLIPSRLESVNTNTESGFHLLLFDRSGSVSLRAKCRSVDDSAFQRECETLAALNHDALLSDIVPSISTGAAGRLRIYVSREIEGKSCAKILQRLRICEWQSLAEEALSTVHFIGSQAKQKLPSLRILPPEVQLMDALEHRFAQLANQGIDNISIEIIVCALDGITVPRHPQHGDLWPGNIIRGVDGRLNIIDYETFGQVQFPLYDALHLMWASRQSLWQDQEWRKACASIFSRAVQRYSLSREQQGALILAFLVELISHRKRPGMRVAYSADLHTHLCWIAKQLEGGMHLEDLAHAEQLNKVMP